jgi:thiol-disulfide isomerase/thioredoxin
LIGFATASPALLQKGVATINLQPECRLHGTIICNELTKLGKPLGWTNVYLEKNGERIASYDSFSGYYEFPVSPGTYSLYAYGECLHKKFVEVNVPGGRSEFEAPPIALSASRLVLLQGQPAPELAGVVGWKGRPVKLADLRGKYVLIDFWGYWCSPCVHAMPVLIDLHEKFADKGLAIISVHIDLDGDVDTPARLDAKTSAFKSSLWGGRELPFPTALSAGKSTPDGYMGLTAEQYGVLGYPTTILIDRQGKVVGEFTEARDFKSASAEIEKLLNPTKS